MRFAVPTILAAACWVAPYGLAHAADLPQPYGRSANYLSPQPVSSWTGVYVGVTAGYGAADKVKGDVYYLDLLGVNPKMDGFLGGATLGYNYQVGQIVFGAEGDISFAAMKQTKSTSGSFLVTGYGPGIDGTYTGAATVKGEIDDLSTLRLRVGYAVGPSLLYVTGGLAIANVKAKLSGTLAGPAIVLAGGLSESKTSTGWTLGAGLEYAFSQNWSAKAEYLYVSIPKETYFSGDPVFAARLSTSVNIARAGLNYRF